MLFSTRKLCREITQAFFQSDMQRERMRYLGLERPAELWMTMEFPAGESPLSD